MKLALLLSFIPFIGFAQLGMPQDANGKFYYKEVVKIDSASSATLFSRAQKHLAIIYVSFKDVSQVNNSESKTIITKGYTDIEVNKSLGMSLEASIYFTITLECKDNRYMVQLSDFFYKSYGKYDDTKYPLERKPITMSKKAYDRWLDNIHARMKEILTTLETKMGTNDNW